MLLSLFMLNHACSLVIVASLLLFSIIFYVKPVMSKHIADDAEVYCSRACILQLLFVVSSKCFYALNATVCR